MEVINHPQVTKVMGINHPQKVGPLSNTLQ